MTDHEQAMRRDLIAKAYSCVSIAPERVTVYWAAARSNQWLHPRFTRELCESHERLRLELDGAMAVIADLEAEIARLKEGRL